MDQVEVTRVIPSTPDAVRELFWAIGDWTRIWGAMTIVDVSYDDGVHQEVAMTVERDSRTERVRTARFLVNGDIVFFSPQPPPTMAVHRGIWAFAPDPGGCRVTARREYSLLIEPGQLAAGHARRRVQYQARFEDRMGSILDSFVDHFETAGVSA
jgi:hypothetical protein